jgi:hypothetical protein
MLQDHLFRIPDQLGHVARRYAALEQKAYESVTEGVWRRPAALEAARFIEHAVDPAPPEFCNGLQAARGATGEYLRAHALPRQQPFVEPVVDPLASSHWVCSVFLRRNLPASVPAA